MGENHLTGREAVRIHRVSEATSAVHESMQLGGAVLEHPGAGPAVGAGENGLVAKLLANPGNFSGHQTFCLIPRDSDKRLLTSASTATAAWPVVEITFPHHGLRDPTRVVNGINHSGCDRGG